MARSTLNGVRTVFPSTCVDSSRVGMLADRYADYSAIPLLKRIGAMQCGAAGYWYVNADIGATLRDEYDRATDQTVKVIDNVRAAAEGALGSVGKLALLAGAAFLALNFFSRRR
jgi:hypothetical protein